MAEQLYTLYLTATTGICLANVLLLGGLGWFYHQGYKQARNRFALGLLAFAGFLAAQNILYITFYMMNFQAFEDVALCNRRERCADTRPCRVDLGFVEVR